MNDKLSECSDPLRTAPSESSVKRDNDRDSLFLTANLRFQNGGEEGQVRVRNLSEGGLMAEAAIRATRGTRLEIELRNIGWISGKIAWVAEKKLGVAFDHPIDPKIVRKPASDKSENVPYYLKKLTRPPSPIKKGSY